MSKIRVLSDLHLEFSNGEFQIPTSVDEKTTILVLAGDIGIAHKKTTYFDFLLNVSSRFNQVIYVLGNHESYRGKFTKTAPLLQETCKDMDNVHILEKESIVFDDVAFVCATMWSDFDDGNKLSMYHAEHMMNDFGIIRIGPKGEPWRRKFKPQDAYVDFMEATEFIFPEITKNKELGHKVVVVTHHAPSHESAAPQYKGLPTAGAYASDLQDEIIETKPDLFIHGHMHNSSDYMIGDTRIICNPRGYTGYELNIDFDPLLTIEI